MSTEIAIDQLISILTTLTVIMVMLNAGLKLTIAEFAWLSRRPRLTARSLLSVDVLAPAVALAIVLMLSGLIPREVGIGILLLAAAPGAPLAPKFVQQAAGNTLYAVSLMGMLSILAVVTFPVTASLILPGGGDVQIDSLGVIRVILVNQLLPLGAGLAVRQFWRTLADDLGGPVSKISGYLFPALIIVIILGNLGTMLSFGPISLGAMLAVLVATLAIGHLLGGPDRRDKGSEPLYTRTALGITASFRNSALALLIANANFGAGVIAAVTVYGILTYAVVIPYASYWKKKQVMEVKQDLPISGSDNTAQSDTAKKDFKRTDNDAA
jgi:bile acid:Na+ symporter, BASS family